MTRASARCCANRSRPSFTGSRARRSSSPWPVAWSFAGFCGTAAAKAEPHPTAFGHASSALVAVSAEVPLEEGFAAAACPAARRRRAGRSFRPAEGSGSSSGRPNQGSRRRPGGRLRCACRHRTPPSRRCAVLGPTRYRRSHPSTMTKHWPLRLDYLAPGDLAEHALALPQLLASRSGQPVVVPLDEFQDVMGSGGAAGEAHAVALTAPAGYRLPLHWKPGRPHALPVRPHRPSLLPICRRPGSARHSLRSAATPITP